MPCRNRVRNELGDLKLYMIGVIVSTSASFGVKV